MMVAKFPPNPTKEVLVWEFSVERGILLSTTAGFCKMIFQFLQRSRWAKSQEFVGPSSPKASGLQQAAVLCLHRFFQIGDIPFA